MILDSKILTHPPPPYISTPTRTGPAPTLSTLPAHTLLHIIYLTFPQISLPDAPKLARQRKTLYWLSLSLRLVDRTFYTACMHVLRSTHIPAYDALVRPPYTSDPFPLLAPPVPSRSGPSSPYASISSNQNEESPLSTIQRETAVLDKFIALKVREDVWADDSELHLERDEGFKDLFNHAQPRARLEDLVRIYGVQCDLICVGNPPPTSNHDEIETSTLASMSSITLAPPHPPQEPDTESKPRLFPPGSTYATSPLSHLSPTPSAASSTFSLPLLTRRISPKPSISLRSLFRPKSKSHLTSSASTSSSTHPYTKSTQRKRTPIPIPISALSITLTPRSAGLVLSRRTIVSTSRTKTEPLESVARRLVGALKAWVEDGGR